MADSAESQAKDESDRFSSGCFFAFIIGLILIIPIWAVLGVVERANMPRLDFSPQALENGIEGLEWSTPRDLIVHEYDLQDAEIKTWDNGMDVVFSYHYWRCKEVGQSFDALMVFDQNQLVQIRLRSRQANLESKIRSMSEFLSTVLEPIEENQWETPDGQITVEIHQYERTYTISILNHEAYSLGARQRSQQLQEELDQATERLEENLELLRENPSP